MKKITISVVYASIIAVSWLGCSETRAGGLVKSSGGDLAWKPAAASAEFTDSRIPHNGSVSPPTAATGVIGSARLSQPVGRFDHLVADTSPGEAMAPQKSDNSDTILVHP